MLVGSRLARLMNSLDKYIDSGRIEGGYKVRRKLGMAMLFDDARMHSRLFWR